MAVFRFYEFEVKLREIKESEKAVLELASAVLEVFESNEVAIVADGYNKERSEKAITTLRNIVSKHRK